MGKTRARTPAAGMTLDAGALIALDRGNKRIIALEAAYRRASPASR
jgi:hypothetical protein